MNATDLLSISSSQDLRAAADRLYTAENNAGEGYDPKGDDLGELILAADADDQVSIYRDGDDAILVGDANGAWAVRVRA